jgi:hypothetical protein
MKFYYILKQLTQNFLTITEEKLVASKLSVFWRW